MYYPGQSRWTGSEQEVRQACCTVRRSGPAARLRWKRWLDLSPHDEKGLVGASLGLLSSFFLRHSDILRRFFSSRCGFLTMQQFESF